MSLRQTQSAPEAEWADRVTTPHPPSKKFLARVRELRRLAERAQKDWGRADAAQRRAKLLSLNAEGKAQRAEVIAGLRAPDDRRIGRPQKEVVENGR